MNILVKSLKATQRVYAAQALSTFKGPRGERGEKGDPFKYEDFTPEQLAALKGAPGYTPQKGIDYTDGKDGKDGKDGYTPVKGVDYFDGAPGYTPIKGVDYFDGDPGASGEPGYTPQRGTDYWTQADQQQIVADVLAALPTWTGGEY